MWLKLTYENTNDKTLININNVDLINSNENKSSNIFFELQPNDPVTVKETLDEIELMIDKQTPSI